MKSNGLTYKEFIALAQEHYKDGGITFVECWEEYQFNDYVRLFGEITKATALKMFEAESRLAVEWAKSYGRG